MGLIKGGFLRFFQTFLYLLAFCCAAIILGIFSYFLAFNVHHNLGVPTWERAVEGLSGSAVLYTIFAVLLTCCLAGIAFFSLIAFILDLLFCGAFIAMAYFTREGANSCSGTVNTPVGLGLGANEITGSSLHYRTACKLNTACFAVAIIGAVLFLITALMQLVLWRNHKKEKMQGPGPDNDYTEGPARKSRFGREKKDVEYIAPVAAAPLVVDHHRDLRPSNDTAMTGSTVAAPPALRNHDKEIDNQGFHHGHAPHVTGVGRPVERVDPTAAPGTILNYGGHTAEPVSVGNRLNFNPPAGNPYGYDNTTTTGTAARNF